ncbi:hypothetical protein BCR42DRAFT_307920, partial [Absidia repens]
LWKTFWSIRTSPASRNIWYRLLHRKWPTSSLLHSFLPNLAPTPFCSFCPTTHADLFHMAIACPSILNIWESIWEYHFIYTPFTTNGLWLALTCLRFPSHPPYNTSPHQWIPVLSTTLLHIWRAHWAHHFDAVPIRPSII